MAQEVGDPSRLNKRVSFGTVVPQESANGIPLSHTDTNFQESFSVYCGIWTRSLSQKFALLGTGHKDTRTIIIRHNTNVYSSLLAKIDGVTYRILDINPDESPSPVSYDLITLEKVTK